MHNHELLDPEYLGALVSSGTWLCGLCRRRSPAGHESSDAAEMGRIAHQAGRSATSFSGEGQVRSCRTAEGRAASKHHPKSDSDRPKTASHKLAAYPAAS